MLKFMLSREQKLCFMIGQMHVGFLIHFVHNRDKKEMWNGSNQLIRVGIWVCIRDDTSTFVLAKTEWFTPVCELHVGEALGLLLALEWVHHLHLGPIDFEHDAKKVVDSFSFAHQDVTEFGMIIHNCKTIFEQYYVNSSVEFVRRQANEVAHRLPKTTTSSTSIQILVETLDCIKRILSNEMI